MRLECQQESVPAVEFLRMFFSHRVEPVSDGGILSTQREDSDHFRVHELDFLTRADSEKLTTPIEK